jgi:pyruvate/2-oxoglutarate dehydrogenase complex dihydrolipoamide acyltransferase (E2) component
MTNDRPPPRCVDLVMPDLGLGETPLVASAWLVDAGAPVVEGDRLLEVLGGVVTVDLPSPVTGRLREWLVAEDDPIQVGARLAVIEAQDA